MYEQTINSCKPFIITVPWCQELQVKSLLIALGVPKQLGEELGKLKMVNRTTFQYTFWEVWAEADTPKRARKQRDSVHLQNDNFKLGEDVGFPWHCLCTHWYGACVRTTGNPHCIITRDHDWSISQFASGQQMYISPLKSKQGRDSCLTKSCFDTGSGNTYWCAQKGCGAALLDGTVNGKNMVLNCYRTRWEIILFHTAWEHDEKFGVVCISKRNLIFFEWVHSLRNEPLFMQIGFKWEYLTKGFDPHIMKVLINVNLDSTGSLAAYSGPYSKSFFFPL